MFLNRGNLWESCYCAFRLARSEQFVNLTPTYIHTRMPLWKRRVLFKLLWLNSLTEAMRSMCAFELEYCELWVFDVRVWKESIKTGTTVLTSFHEIHVGIPIQGSVLRWRPVLSRFPSRFARIACRSNLCRCKHIFDKNVLIFTSLNLTKWGNASKTETSHFQLKVSRYDTIEIKITFIFDRRNISSLFIAILHRVVSFDKQILMSEVDECEEMETGKFIPLHKTLLLNCTI